MSFVKIWDLSDNLSLSHFSAKGQVLIRLIFLPVSMQKSYNTCVLQAWAYEGMPPPPCLAAWRGGKAEPHFEAISPSRFKQAAMAPALPHPKTKWGANEPLAWHKQAFHTSELFFLCLSKAKHETAFASPLGCGRLMEVLLHRENGW